MTTPTLTIGDELDSGFYTGVVSTEVGVPHNFDVQIAGTGYLVDWVNGGIEWKSVPLLKGDQGANQSEPGESSINPEGKWRRAQSSWHYGAGQDHRDQQDSDPRRFRSSKGIDVWTRGELSLLEDTEQLQSLGGTGAKAKVVSTSAGIYYTDDQTVYFHDGATRTAVTGTPAADVEDLVSVGSKVYAAYGVSGVYSISGTTATNITTDDASIVGWAKGRVLMANGKTLSDVSTGTPAELLGTNLDSSFVWTAIGEGTSHAYACGNIGNRGYVYRIAVEADGTGLDVPIPAAPPLVGETYHAILGHLGALILGTSKGVRLAAVSAAGDLEIGPVINLGVTVQAFAARDEYVWFGWTNYDTASTGVGRLDLSTFTSDLVPAYASDLMVTGQGIVDGLALLDDELVIGVVATGIYQPTGAPVASGSIDLGVITYDVTEEKLHTGGLIHGDGDIDAYLSLEGGTFTLFAESGELRRGAFAELRLVLTAASGVSPTARGVTVQALPATDRTELIVASLLMAPILRLGNGIERGMDIQGAFSQIRSLMATRQIVSFQEGNQSYTVTVEDYRRIGLKASDHPYVGEFPGVLVVTMKLV
jgi:hypothetical protein